MKNKEKISALNKLKVLTEREISLTSLCDELNLNEFEVLNLIKELRLDGINIITQKCDDDLYLLNQGEAELEEENIYSFKTDRKNEFKFVAISDTRFGSKSQQLSILNDIYQKAHDLGYNNVIHCGNMTEGLFPITSNYSSSNFLDDSLMQINYIARYYPQVEGIKTYFITGKKDEKHLKDNKINLGKRINDLRNDMVYLGHGNAILNIDKTSLMIFNSKLNKTYTVSYRPEQQVNSFRSEDKPDIILFGGLLQMEKFTHRSVKCISVPSVCATTPEMNDKRYANTVGAWYVTIKTNEKGKLESIKAIDSVYYETKKNDYLTSKVLKLKKGGK